MPYIGNTNTTQAFTPAVDFFNGNGSTTAFTLSRPVASVAQVQAVIENVPQNPGDAFTVSGNTITFTSAPPSGTQNIYVYYTSPITQVIAPGQGTVGTSALVDGAVTTAKIADSAITTAKIAAGAVVQADLATGVAGTGPAFSAYSSGTQSLASATATKVVLPTEDFDTANCFDNATNYRFTPNVAGYYQLNGVVYVSSTGTSAAVIAVIYKNGSPYQGGSFQNTGSPGSNGAGQIASVVYLNGTTDYVELYAYAVLTGTGNLSDAGALGLKPRFNGALVRAA